MNKKHEKLKREFGEPKDEKETDSEYQPSVCYDSIHEMPNKQNVYLVKTELIQYNSVKENQNNHTTSIFNHQNLKKKRNFVLWMALSKASNWT